MNEEYYIGIINSILMEYITKHANFEETFRKLVLVGVPSIYAAIMLINIDNIQNN